MALTDRITKEVLDELYHKQGLPTDEIAKRFGCSGRLIRYQTKRFGIQRPAFAIALHHQKLAIGGIKTRLTSSDPRGIQFRFKKGIEIPWKGQTKETSPIVAKIAAAKIGKKRPDVTGPNHHFWKGGVTSEVMKIRKSFQYREWRDKVFKRDGYTCQKCGAIGGPLEGHHIKPFSKFPELRFSVENGITVCKKCHRSKGFHDTTTPFQPPE